MFRGPKFRAVDWDRGCYLWGRVFCAYEDTVLFWLGPLKTINPYPLDQVQYYFMEYENINVFSLPVSRFDCGVVSALCRADTKPPLVKTKPAVV